MGVQMQYVRQITPDTTQKSVKLFRTKSTPLPFQIEGAKFALSNVGCIIGDEMGLGKTIQAIGVMNGMKAFPRVLIVCPSVAKYNWLGEIEDWRTYPYTAAVMEGKTGVRITRADVIIINYDILDRFKEELKSIIWDLVICDEFHYLRNQKSKRSKVVFSLQTRKKLYLSGTPIPNKVKNLWAPLRSLSPVWGSYQEFTKQYCGGHFEWQGRYREWWAEGASNLDELYERLKPFMIRRKAAAVLNLPPLVTTICRIEPDAEERALAQEIAKLAKELLALGKAVDISRMKPQDLAGAQIPEYRRKAGQTKLPFAIQKIKEIIQTGEKVVVFAYHREITQELHKAFPQSVMVIGGVPSLKKKQAADTFQKDPKCNVFVGNIESAGVALTLTAAHHMIFVEHDWRPDTILQAMKRCHRIGQTKAVYITFLVLDDSIDVNMAHSIDRKIKHMQQALDGIDPTWAELVFERNKHDREADPDSDSGDD